MPTACHSGQVEPMLVTDVPPDDTDQDDLRRSAAGDQLAFARIVERHLGPITAFAERMLCSHAEAEEVAQDVFLYAWLHAGQWKQQQARYTTWLHQVAISRCTDRLRQRREMVQDAMSELVDPQESSEQCLQQQAVAHRMKQALDTLPTRQRAAVILCHYQELSNIEAALALDVSVDALESLLARGRRSLRARLLVERVALTGDLS